MKPFREWTSAVVKEMNLIPQWHYLLEHFEAFDYRRPLDPCRLDMRRPDNVVGHWQRTFNIWWAIQQCFLTGEVGIELGSAGVQTPWCLSTDVRTGLPSHYPASTPVSDRERVRGHIPVDASYPDKILDRTDPLCGDTSQVLGTGIFPTGSFALVLANHVLEHMARAPAIVLAEWARFLRPGGVLGIVCPDARWGNVMAMDPDHKHAWQGHEFEDIARSVPGLSLLEHTAASQINYFSFATVWVRR